MKEIKMESLVYFQKNCKSHIDSLRKITNYDFNSNLALIQEFLGMTEFVDGVSIHEKDYKKYIVEDTFLIGIDIFDDIQYEEYKYLFDAFNVYCFSESAKLYIRDEQLTRIWRTFMKTNFIDTTYIPDLKLSLEEERKQEIAEINKKIDSELSEV